MPPVLLKGNISKNKLMAQARMKKLSKLPLLKNFKFLKTKIKNKKPIIDIIKNPRIPVSVNICK